MEGLDANVQVSEKLVLRRDAESVATLTLNRPTQYNALSLALLREMQTVLDAIAADNSVRVVVIEARGEAFCAGHDLKEMLKQRTLDACARLFKQCSDVMVTLSRLPQPTIARVQGLATAAGCQLVGACDLAVASERAQFAVSGINVGLFCSTPAVALSRNVPRKVAMEMLLTGDFIDAQTARERGLINRVVRESDLDDEVNKLTRSIVAKSATAISMGKALFYRQLEMGLEGAYALASEVIARNVMSEDAAEGIEAFLAKRLAVWTPRGETRT